jgi:hypothetical protein
MLNLGPDEKIVLKVRRHVFALIIESAFLFVWIILPPFIFYFVDIEKSLFVFIYSSVLLFGWLVFFKIWTDYYLDVLVITNERVVDIEQKGFFNRDIAILRLDQVEDIRVNIRGIIATFLDFGELNIQTAAESKEFVMRNIPNPNRVKSVLFDLQDKLAERPQPVHIVPPNN